MTTPPALRAAEYQWMNFLAFWQTVVLNSILQPLLYIVGMGIGVGVLVDQRPQSAALLGGLTYFQFFAPAIMATTAMIAGANEAMWPVLGGFKWTHQFPAQMSTPITPVQAARGVLIWLTVRVVIAASGVALMLLVFPPTRSLGVFPAIVFATLTGMAFAAPVMAWSASRDEMRSFPAINRFVLVPMFLFAGEFYPITELPRWLQGVAWVTPLWHGVELCRASVVGHLSVPFVLKHSAVPLVYVVVGTVLGQRMFMKRVSS